jgi:hypothetical protein
MKPLLETECQLGQISTANSSPAGALVSEDFQLLAMQPTLTIPDKPVKYL